MIEIVMIILIAFISFFGLFIMNLYDELGSLKKEFDLVKDITVDTFLSVKGTKNDESDSE